MNMDLRTAFPSFENKLIENLEDKAEIKVFEPGEVLMKTGQYFKSILLIVDGLIKVYREDEEGHEYFIYYLQPGQACALSMMSASKQEKSEVLGKVVERTTVIAAPLEYMDQWMHDYKSWYNFVLETYRKRFEELLITLDHTAFRNMDEKLIFYLKREQLIHRTNMLTVNNTEVAQELNSSREVISRLMKKLAERGMIKQLKNQSIEIVKLEY
ncbi:MAG: Crp/Fnr family transcriptional regulator [Sphingobacteriales bacterium]|nr:Crp/Fnr family transcriptional regulator [Sphingobacteriales bacterium]